ncbi:ABC transporter substrate-binding protein [Pseudoalteromonas sp. SR44-5]|uniref:heme/hemin ABC transporter substrate-binding protein n=1 Tax=unclassified Pseudoalteromonas TaxID=194690 RepID=UPI0015FF5F18|nr:MULTISPECIES: ABC transporter substrate-binding protein [unclassified Pseudoalteromonas]MBB1365314.1 ABC transporter substrate-binding protein [Pseudoalteromonas sp. SR44-5]MBB1416872.1 ABC transporter substrate-binding protein [Pseudoalteromonas sp. SG44-1]MBB1421465.1 ABC transporter substrate-binding protein [Pseudoalteromonas sp. SG43-7]MBB1478686.1 ABC transporter substrate-binding protein [Pseudoalteromonas sp. SG41-2]
MRYLFILILLTVHPLSAQERIVSAGGTLTEIIFALDKQNTLVAVDQSSLYPKQATQLDQIGYYRDLAAEGVLSVRPTKLLALEGAGRAQALAQIEATGVELIHYKKPNSINDLLNLVKRLGKDLNANDKAQVLVAQIKNSLPPKASNETHSALFLLSANERGLVAAGTDTVADLLLDYAGVTNLGATHKGFKVINNEVLAVKQPDFLIAPAHVVYSLGGKEAFCNQPTLRLLTAAKQCRLLVMDSLLSLGMSPRIATGIKELSDYKATL